MVDGLIKGDATKAKAEEEKVLKVKRDAEAQRLKAEVAQRKREEAAAKKEAAALKKREKEAEDFAEGDYIEVGMIGAYGAALATKFNGFGVYETAEVSDTPFATMFGDLVPGSAQGAFIEKDLAR